LDSLKYTHCISGFLQLEKSDIYRALATGLCAGYRL